ncbi:hypothetical protein [Heyndrickxia acidiproducens]|uniref:hypothetical protein n=1 Tax=Heyndrickxia acidiproducens TaxID=1121084 RepID=UPI0003697372|nr:hypothetical protein [Heyndrickxia acidiproducens]
MQDLSIKASDNYFEKHTSKVDIHVFDREGVRPFENFPFSTRKVYEFADYTMRTPLEKTEAFYELLKIPYEAEIWILPTTEQSSKYMAEIQEPKAAALFSFLSKVKNTIQRDRTFIVCDKSKADFIMKEMGSLGFSLTEMDEQELKNLAVSFGS